MINLLLTRTLKLNEISLAFIDCFFFGDFPLADTDPCFELLTLHFQKLVFSKFLSMATIKLFTSLHLPE